MTTSRHERALTDCGWLPLEQLSGTAVLVTGGTGLIGYNIIKELCALSDSLRPRIFALVRNRQKAEKTLAAFGDRVQLITGDVQEPLSVDGPIDYIIHGASITSSRSFVEQPVETIMTSVMGVRNLLELAREKKVRSMVYLSSMEVYGSPTQDRLLTEKDLDYLDPLAVRSSYPQSKRLCEALCTAYASQHGVPVKIARLAQTFGPGMQPGDRRAIIQFLESALSHQDIHIKASGESARMYLYTFDAVSALLTILLNGQNSAAYNIANKESYCSIRVLAETIVQMFSPHNQVFVNTGTQQERAIYPPDSFLRLDVSKLERLGWAPQVCLREGLQILGQTLNDTH